jgi:hypothetical protein
MRNIRKAPEPPTLAEWRRQNPNATVWTELSVEAKRVVQDQLVRDQFALCAYCEGRIRAPHRDDDDAGGVQVLRAKPGRAALTVEHWISRRWARVHAPALTFAWSNMLGVCPGTPVGKRPQDHQTVDGWTPDLRAGHCDEIRGDQTLKVDPVGTGVSIAEQFRHLANGCVATEDPMLREDLHTLNLNHWRLCENRIGVLEALRKTLERLGPRVSRAALERVLEQILTPGPRGELPEYVETARFYLERWIRARPT